jgi:hypothetical protein
MEKLLPTAMKFALVNALCFVPSADCFNASNTFSFEYDGMDSRLSYVF